MSIYKFFLPTMLMYYLEEKVNLFYWIYHEYFRPYIKSASLFKSYAKVRKNVP